MRFFEVFDSIDADKKISTLFEDVEVERVTASRKSDRMDVYLKCPRIISRANVKKMENMLQKQLFSRAGKTVELHEEFLHAEDKGLEKLWSIYRDCIEDELKEKSAILYNMFRNAHVDVSGDTIALDLEDSFLCHMREAELRSYFESIWSGRFGMQPTVRFTYRPVKSRKEKERKEDDIAGTPHVQADKPQVQPDKPQVQADKPQVQADKTRVQSDTGNERSPGFKGKSSAYDKARGFRKKLPDDPDIFYGHSFDGDITKIEDIIDEIGEVVIQGKIIKCEDRELRSGKFLVTASVTDFTDSIGIKLFLGADQKDEVVPCLEVGKFVRLKGVAMFDTYKKEVTVGSIVGIKNISDFTERRRDTADEKRVELHAHTMMSDMDAVVDTGLLVRTAFEWGHSAVAITDHGVVQAFPDASHAIDIKKLPEAEQERAKHFKVIYGMEAYLVDDEPDVVINAKGHEFKKGEDGRYSVEDIRKMPSYHAIILCRNNTGRVNLYKLVSLSHLEYFSRRPRIPKSLLRENREGLLIGSACEAGELFQAILWDKPEEETARIAAFYDYYEIQPIGNNRFMIDSEKIPQVENENDLRRLNRRIYELGMQDKKLVVATCDVHFLNPEDEIYRRIIMSAKGFEDADKQAPLYLRTTDEMIDEFRYLGDDAAYEVVVENTRRISNMIEKISPVRPDKCPPIIENSDQTLRDICYSTAHSMYGESLPKMVADRLEHELESIIKNGFAVMYIIAQKLVWKSNEDGYLVGSRGSVGSSFVATMAGITEINPLPAHYYCTKCHYSDFDSDDVKRFAGSSGCDMPDKLCPQCKEPLTKEGHDIPFETFLGFYGDKEPDIDLNFSGEYQSKAHDYTEVIFGKGQTFRAGTIGTLAEKTAYGYVLKYCEEHQIRKRSDEIERVAGGCVGVKRTTGQHPGGIIVLPHGEEIYSFTPVQHPANDMSSKIITTHFDYHSIDHNLLKLDILGHDDPTMIRALEDYTGLDAKTIKMDDAKVMSLFKSTEALGIKPEDIGGCDLGSLGLPELGTDFVMQMLRDTKPTCFSDMVRISGLSHGTDVWLNNTQTLISEGKCTLSTAICTRDDIMTYLIRMGVESGLAFKIMESVRKGKGLTPEMQQAMEEKNVPEWYIWSCKRIKYMFPKAHACAYVMMALRIAYFKIYYPLAYYAAYFGIRSTGFNFAKMCLGREVLEKYLNDYKRRSNELTAKEQDELRDMKIVQEMYARGFEFVPIDLYKAKAKKFLIADGKIMPSFNSIEGLGEKAAEQVEEAAAQGIFLSREDFKNRTKVSAGVVEQMNTLGLFGDLPESNQISLMDFMQ